MSVQRKVAKIGQKSIKYPQIYSSMPEIPHSRLHYAPKHTRAGFSAAASLATFEVMSHNLNLAMDTKEVKHHQQQSLCETRPAYRQGRRLTAVKAYTVSSESQHLFVYGVPKINLFGELKALCSRYGKVSRIRLVVDHETEIFTECYHATYERIEFARRAKRLLDNRSFYGGLLHVCYAPEFESVDETRRKLQQRSEAISRYKE